MPPIKQRQIYRNQQRNDPHDYKHHQTRAETWSIQRRVVEREEQRADDVARTHADKHHRRCAFLLRIARGVLDVPRIYNRRDGRQARYEVVSKQQQALVSARNRQHDDRSDGRQNRHQRYRQTFALEPRGAPAGTQDGDDLNGAERDVEEYGFEVGVAKVLDDQVTKRADAAARDPESLCISRSITSICA